MLWLLPLALARTIDGIEFPDTATVGGQPVVLNGVGLREKFTFDIYYGALYLPQVTHTSAEAIQADVPKRTVMRFVYGKGVTRAQLVEAFQEGFAKNPAAAGEQAGIAKLEAWLPEVAGKGDTIVFDYAPGAGTTMTLNGRAMGSIPGVGFMRVLWAVWLGSNPPTTALKAGMLGQ